MLYIYIYYIYIYTYDTTDYDSYYQPGLVTNIFHVFAFQWPSSGGFSYEHPVPKLQLPLHSGRSQGRSNDGRTSRRSPKRSARLTSQCSTVTWALVPGQKVGIEHDCTTIVCTTSINHSNGPVMDL